VGAGTRQRAPKARGWSAKGATIEAPRGGVWGGGKTPSPSGEGLCPSPEIFFLQISLLKWRVLVHSEALSCQSQLPMTTCHRISFVSKQLELHARKHTTALSRVCAEKSRADCDTGIFLLVNSMRYVIVILTFTVNHNSRHINLSELCFFCQL